MMSASEIALLNLNNSLLLYNLRALGLQERERIRQRETEREREKQREQKVNWFILSVGLSFEAPIMRVVPRAMNRIEPAGRLSGAGDALTRKGRELPQGEGAGV